MRSQPLSEFLSKKEQSQEQVAKLFSVTQSAVSKMLRSPRTIHVVELDNGILELWEHKCLARSRIPTSSHL